MYRDPLHLSFFKTMYTHSTLSKSVIEVSLLAFVRELADVIQEKVFSISVESMSKNDVVRETF